MRAVRPLLTVLATLVAPFAAVSASAGALADVEVYDRTAGQTLPIYEHEGRFYVAGEPRHQYEVRVRNSSSNRLLAVTSVDGVNVITGQTAAQQQSGYVLDAWDSVNIEGWRKSMDDVATFYFTRLKDSYAARTGRPDDVGVIGVALFREYRPYRPCCAGRREGASPGVVAPPEVSGEMQDDSAELSRDAASNSERRAQKAESESKLGTGHGHRESSPAQYVDFRRASTTPDETIVIYYDSRRNLVAQGVLPQRAWYADRRPDPFPSGFVPDPR
jgi:hypothetical protein